MEALPSMQFTFDLDVTGEMTLKKYQGHFTYLRPNIEKKIKISSFVDKLLGSHPSSEDSRIRAYMQASLHVCLIEFPKWWEDSRHGLELYDENVILELFSKVSEFETEWTNKIKATNSQSQENQI